jgi:hypothetical protein
VRLANVVEEVASSAKCDGRVAMMEAILGLKVGAIVTISFSVVSATTAEVGSDLEAEPMLLRTGIISCVRL